MIDSKYNVQRIITVYSEKTEELVDELELSSFNLKSFQNIFNVNDNENPMIECYEIEPKHVNSISKFLKQKYHWDFEKYSYFLEAYAV